MKIFSKYLLGASLAMTMNFDASALSITPSSPTPILIFTATSQATIDQEINNYFADPDPTVVDPTVVYKQDVGGSESGAFAASYSTAFFNSPSDPAEATISYGGFPLPKITDLFSEVFLLVKDGSANPSAYLFDISPPLWDGMDSLVLTEFWPDQGAISHVSIYARGINGNGSTQVPDGGATLMLLGVAFGGLETLRRKIARKSDSTASHEGSQAA